MDTTKHFAKTLYHVSIEKQPSVNQKNIWGVEYDTLTLISGFIVPLLAFILGFLASILRDRFREKTSIKIASESFIMWINKTIVNAKLLLTEIEKKKDQTEALDGFEVSKVDYINLHLNRLASDQNLLYKAFVKYKRGSLKDNSNDYSKIIVDIDFLGDFQKILLQNSQYIVDQFQNLFIQWNDSIRYLHKTKHNLVGRRANEENDKIKTINDSFNEWYKTDNSGLSDTNKFLTEIEPALLKFYNKDPSDDELAELLSTIQKTKVIYNQFIFEKSEVVKLLSTFHKQLSETITEMDTLSKKIIAKKDKLFHI